MITCTLKISELFNIFIDVKMFQGGRVIAPANVPRLEKNLLVDRLRELLHSSKRIHGISLCTRCLVDVNVLPFPPPIPFIQKVLQHTPFGEQISFLNCSVSNTDKAQENYNLSTS